MRREFIFLLLILIQCNSVYEVHKIEGFDLSAKSDENSLRNDGLYALYDTSLMECGVKCSEHYTIYSPLIFINTKKVTWKNSHGYFDYKALSLSNYTDYSRFTNFVGDYIVNNDTLLAKIPITLYGGGMRQKIYESYFQGVIRNSDTISDWHMIEPYPNANPKFNDDFYFLKTPHMLYFMESKDVSFPILGQG